jgi:hypothetical protein
MITQKRMSLVTAALVGASAVAAACSSSSSSSPPAETNNTPVDASAELGDGPISQLNPPTMTPTTPTAMPVQCGSMTCNPPSSVAFPLSACCLPDNGCGASFGGAAAAMFGGGGGDAGAICLDTSAGTPDTACPSQSAMGFSLPGCCTSGGMCGVDLSMAGLGCNSLSALASLAPAGTLGGSDAGAPLSCSAAAAAAADGGTADGG